AGGPVNLVHVSPTDSITRATRYTFMATREHREHPPVLASGITPTIGNRSFFPRGSGGQQAYRAAWIRAGRPPINAITHELVRIYTASEPRLPSESSDS